VNEVVPERGRLSALDAPTREALTHVLRRSRERADAAAWLWTCGHIPLAISHAQEALEFALELAERAAGGAVGGATQRFAALSAAGLTPHAVKQIQEAAQLAEAPRWLAETTSAHARSYARLREARRRIDRALEPILLTEVQRRARLARRSALALLFMASLAAMLISASVTRVRARASRYFGNDSAQYGPGRAIDGDPATSWLLPDATQGELTIELPRLRELREIRLLNTENPPYADSASRTYRVDILRREHIELSFTASFPDVSPPDWVVRRVEIPQADKIRITVLSYYRVRGGLAEVRWQ
jgi:hypothetical protein